jgi:hydrogenase maturation factor HypE
MKDENVNMKLKIHAATVKMQAFKHTLEIMDMSVGVDNAIKFLDRYREDTLTQIRKSKGDESAYTYEELEQRKREAVFWLVAVTLPIALALKKRSFK